MISSNTRTLAVAMMMVTGAMAMAQDIGVQVNGTPVRFNNAQPQYISGRVLVPLRGVFENMGANVQWHPATRTVTARRGSTDVKLKIGEKWATVDGRTNSLDVPAMILNGSTMVPIRFLSESLGAQVSWNDPNRMVSIITNYANNNGNNNNNNSRPIEFRNTRRFTMSEGTVIPVVLDTEVSSKDSRRGDLVRAHVADDFNTGEVSWRQGDFTFPPGTKVEGRVVSAVPKNGDRPGLIELDFNRIMMADGKTVPIDGSLISLDSKSVVRNENGVLVATGNVKKDNRMVYAGYGAGAGLIVGLLTKRPLENLAIGGILGYLVGSLEQSQKRANDVSLQSGTKFGVRLDQAVAVNVPYTAQR